MTTEDAPSGDPRVEAFVHLQRAALECIAAARALLDLAEDAVRAPGGLAAVVAETAGAFVAAARAPRAPRVPSARHGDGDGDGHGDRDGDGGATKGAATGRVQRIRIS
jgi:hypothetical protein